MSDNAVIILIADAVVSSLNGNGGGSFSQSFEAARHYVPVLELKDTQALAVLVVPKSVAIANASRHQSFIDCVIDIGVLKKVTSEDLAEIDAMTRLVEEIGDHLRFRKLDAFPNASWLGIENEPVYAPEHLVNLRQFTSVISVTYRVAKSG